MTTSNMFKIINDWGLQEVNQGWQCPVCSRVWAPSVASCGCHQANHVISTTDTAQPVEDFERWPHRDDLPTEDPDAND